jgi:hypothetical protein
MKPQCLWRRYMLLDPGLSRVLTLKLLRAWRPDPANVRPPLEMFCAAEFCPSRPDSLLSSVIRCRFIRDLMPIAVSQTKGFLDTNIGTLTYSVLCQNLG